MKVRWEGDECLADQSAIAELYGVCRRTVRRHCTPAREYPSAGRGSTRREYDAIAAGEQLAAAGVIPRPERTAAALRRTRITAALYHRTPTQGADL